MKTTTYTTANTMRSLVASLIILTSFSGIAQSANSNRQFITTVENEYHAKDFVEAELATETANFLNGNDEASTITESEIASEGLAYNAKNFVEAELATETANFLNGNDGISDENAEPELALEIKAYDAKEFVEADLEIESWTNNSTETFGSETRTICCNELVSN